MFDFDTPITSDLTLEAQWDCLIHEAIILTHTSGAGGIKINNLWAGPIYVNSNEVQPDESYTATVTAGDNAVFEISATKETLEQWNEFAYEPIIVADGTSTALFDVNVPNLSAFLLDETIAPDHMFYQFVAYPAIVASLSGFDTNSITEAGDYVFRSFAQSNTSLTAFPAGSFRFHNLTKAGAYFFGGGIMSSTVTLPADSMSFENLEEVTDGFLSSFMGGNNATSLPAEAFRFNKLKTAGGGFLSSFGSAQVTAFPSGSFNFDSLGEVGYNAFNGFLQNSSTLTSLPDGSFSFKNLTTIGAGFCASFNENGSLESLPAGSFKTDKLNSLPDRAFRQFNKGGKLKTLSTGSFHFGEIQEVGANVFAGFNQEGQLVALPENSFNTTNFPVPSSGFLSYFNYNGSLIEGDKKVSIYAPIAATQFAVGQYTNLAAGQTVYVNSNPNPIDPNNATFAMVKLALATDDPASALPIGTEIADTWNGQSNPLIIAHYTNITLADGTTKPGCYLVRKYVEPTNQRYGTRALYGSSDVQTYLESTYRTLSSDELLDAMATIAIPYYQATSLTQANVRFFLMSGIEVGGGANSGEGEMWDYWKQKTGLTSANGGDNSGRIMRNRGGSTQNVWLRSYFDDTRVWTVNKSGGLAYGAVTETMGVLPACAIVAD